MKLLNKLNYKLSNIKDYRKKLMIEEIKGQREGFFDILPKEYFSYMDWRDLQKLIIGVPSVEVDDLQLKTEYINYDKNNQTIL